MSFFVVASVHFNFYPGTMESTPPDYRRYTISDPHASRDSASNMMLSWLECLTSPGWKVEIREAESAESLCAELGIAVRRGCADVA